MKKSTFSLRKRLKAFKYAFNGLYLFFFKDQSAIIHTVATIIAIALGIYFQINTTEWMLIAFAISLVLISEMLNSSIEKLCDVVEPDWNYKVGQVKDVSAGAVLIASILSLIIAGIIFIPKITSTLLLELPS